MRFLLIISLVFWGINSWAQCDPFPAMTIQETRPDSTSEWTGQIRNTFTYDEGWNTTKHHVEVFYEGEWQQRSITEKEFDVAGHETYYHLLDWDYRNNFLRIDQEITSEWEGDEKIRREETKKDLENIITYHHIRTGSVLSGEIIAESKTIYLDFTLTWITIQTYNSAGYETSYYHEGYNQDGVLLKEKIEFFFDENNCQTGSVQSDGKNGFLEPRDSIYAVTNEYCDVLEKYEYEYQGGRWVLFGSEKFRYTREFNDQEQLTYYLKEKQLRDEWLVDDEEKYEYDENGYLTYTFENYSQIDDEQVFYSYSDGYMTTETLLQRRRPSEGNIWVDVKMTKVSQHESGNLTYAGVWRYFEELEQLELTTEEIWELNAEGNIVTYKNYRAYPPSAYYSRSLRHNSYGCNDRFEGYISTIIDYSDPSLIGHQIRIVYEFSDLVTGIENPAPPVTIYPNPAKTEIFFKIISGEPLNITFMDLQGRVIRQFFRIGADGPLMFDVSDLEPGVYLFKVSGVNFNISRKVLITN